MHREVPLDMHPPQGIFRGAIVPMMMRGTIRHIRQSQLRTCIRISTSTSKYRDKGMDMDTWMDMVKSMIDLVPDPPEEKWENRLAVDQEELDRFHSEVGVKTEVEVEVEDEGG